MKSLQVVEGREFRILDLPIPEPGSGEVRVRVDAVTICTQWDLHLRHNEPMTVGHQFHYPYTPGQPGHEASGVVDAVGEGVQVLAVGDRVSVWRDPGHHLPGAYAQYVVRPTHEVIKVPAELPAYATAPVELAMCVACTYLVLGRLNVLQGRRVAIFGLGPAGLIALQMARAEGAAEVYGIDRVAQRREAALAFGAQQTFSPEEAAGFFTARPEGNLDVSVDCVGSRAVVQFALDHSNEAVALFGVQREDYTFSPNHFVGLSLIGYPPHHRGAAEYAVDMIAAGKLDLAPLVTHRMPLERYAEAIDLLEAQQAVKVCLEPWA